MNVLEILDVSLRLVASASLTSMIFPKTVIGCINSVGGYFESLGDRFTLDKNEFKMFTLIIKRAKDIGAFDNVTEYNKEANAYINKYANVTWLNARKNHKPLLMSVHRMLSNDFINHIRYDTTRYLPEWVDIKNEHDAIKCIDRLNKFLTTFADKRHNVVSNEIDRYIEDMQDKYHISKSKQRGFN